MDPNLFKDETEQFFCELALHGIDPFHTGGEYFKEEYIVEPKGEGFTSLNAKYNDEDSILFTLSQRWHEAIKKVERELGTPLFGGGITDFSSKRMPIPKNKREGP